MHFVFMFQLILFFRNLRSWKARFSHRSILPTRYVLKIFRFLEFRNRVRNWNKIKNFLLVGSKIQLLELVISIFIYKLMCQITLINSVSFLFCEIIRVTSRKMQNYYFSTIIISNSQIEIMVSYSRSTNVNVNMSFPNSKFEGNFSTYVFGYSFWHYRELKNENWTSRHQ
jgi:hypothetical protein